MDPWNLLHKNSVCFLATVSQFFDSFSDLTYKCLCTCNCLVWVWKVSIKMWSQIGKTLLFPTSVALNTFFLLDVVKHSVAQVLDGEHMPSKMCTASLAWGYPPGHSEGRDCPGSQAQHGGLHFQSAKVFFCPFNWLLQTFWHAMQQKHSSLCEWDWLFYAILLLKKIKYI